MLDLLFCKCHKEMHINIVIFIICLEKPFFHMVSCSYTNNKFTGNNFWLKINKKYTALQSVFIFTENVVVKKSRKKEQQKFH